MRVATMFEILNREKLIEQLAREPSVSVKFLFFWGHTPKVVGRVDVSCLSQWFPRRFEIDGVAYATAEHFMMAEKARVFGDDAALARVLLAKSAAEAKAIGREVRGYTDSIWEGARFDAVVRGNLAKFGQHADLGAFLLSTQDRVIVEASPRDCIWGIGMGASNPDARTPARWSGRNLLGFALMDARDRLRSL